MKIKAPFLIAEISANHCGNFSLAKKLVKCAKVNGANAVKLQTYTADSMTIKSKKKYFKINSGIWKGYSLWELYDEAHTPLRWHKKLFDYGKKIGITVFSTPFDESAVDFLEKLKCPIYKVASFEMTDIPLIKKIAKTKKPMIISTGMASMDEIELTYKIAKKYGAKDISLLYCVSNYPSAITDFNLNNIKILKSKFKCKVGLSDHSNDERIAIAAISAGAEIVEKHIALDNQTRGLDIKFSLKGKKIKNFKNNIDLAYRLLGENKFFRNSTENKSKLLRRSIFITQDIKKGEKFTKFNIRRIRPGHGIEPKYYEKIIGQKSPKNLLKGEPFSKKIYKIIFK
jgi:pseudaminic acid synthase